MKMRKAYEPPPGTRGSWDLRLEEGQRLGALIDARVEALKAGRLHEHMGIERESDPGQSAK